jgi:hypothetical protein
MTPKRKRLVVLADLHSGHEFGLCPPAWWAQADKPGSRRAKAGRFQRQLWGFYTRAIDSLKPIDILAVNGDAIEGKGERSGGVELITADRLEQVKMAAESINYAEAPVVRLVHGTRYHTGRDEDFEEALKAIVKGKAAIHGHDFLDINGRKVDLKHKVGSSAIPHGRMTAIARARLWNVVWNSEHERQPRADIIIRSHVHYFGYCGGANWLGMTTPALTYNSAFGIRECEGLVDVGLIVFDFEDDGSYTWRPILAGFDKLTVKAEML